MPTATAPQLYDRERCKKRTRLAARQGFEACPVKLYGSAPPEAIAKGTLVSARGSMPKGDAALAKINSVLALDKPLTADQVHIHYLEAGNTNYVQSRLMFLAPSTLKNIAKAGDEGFAFMNSHRTGGMSSPAELPMGRTFAGRYENWAIEGGKSHSRTILGFYMLSGEYPNGTAGPSTDSISAGINGGTLFDVSLGLKGPYKAICDVCGHGFSDRDPETDTYLCNHIPGTTRKMTGDQKKAQQARGVPDGVATYSIDGASAGEISAVFDGAVTGAGFRRALSAQRSGQLSLSELAQFHASYGHLINPRSSGGLARRVPALGRPLSAAPTAKGKRMARISLADLIGRLRDSEQDLADIEVDLDDTNGEELGATLPIKLSATASEDRKPDPEVVKLRQELSQERSERQRERREEKLSGIDKDVEVFLASEKSANRLSGEEQVKALRLSLKQAAVDDLDHPVKDHSRFATLKSYQLAAKPHEATKEVIANGKKPADLTALSNQGDDVYDPVKLAKEQNDRVLGGMGQKPSH